MALNKGLCVSTCVLVFACAKVSQRTSASLEAIIPPILQADVGPVYPLHAREQGLQGSVGLYLLVTDSGQVKLVRISDSSGYDILDNAASQYAKRLQFHPPVGGENLPVSGSPGEWITGSSYGSLALLRISFSKN